MRKDWKDRLLNDSLFASACDERALSRPFTRGASANESARTAEPIDSLLSYQSH